MWTVLGFQGLSMSQPYQVAMRWAHQATGPVHMESDMKNRMAQKTAELLAPYPSPQLPKISTYILK